MPNHGHTKGNDERRCVRFTAALTRRAASERDDRTAEYAAVAIDHTQKQSIKREENRTAEETTAQWQHRPHPLSPSSGLCVLGTLRSAPLIGL